LRTGVNYFMYTSNSPKVGIGDEFDIFIHYNYSENLSFRLVYGAFMAGKIAEESADKFLSEVLLKF